MTYVKTTLQHSIDIDAIITLHYFEYMQNFEFKGESHNFWEFLYVDKGTVAVRADDTWTTLYTGDIIFHQPNEFHAIKSIGKDSPNLVVMSFTSSLQREGLDVHVVAPPQKGAGHDLQNHHGRPAYACNAYAHSFGRTGTVKGTCTFWLPADDSPLS